MVDLYRPAGGLSKRTLADPGIVAFKGSNRQAIQEGDARGGAPCRRKAK